MFEFYCLPSVIFMALFLQSRHSITLVRIILKPACISPVLHISVYTVHFSILYSFTHCCLVGLQRRRLIPAPTLDSAPSSPSHRSSKQTITSSSSSSSSPGACWVDGPLGPPAPSNLRGAVATAETFEIKVYEIDDVERLQKRREKAGNKVRQEDGEKMRSIYCSGRLMERKNKGGERRMSAAGQEPNCSSCQ